MCECSLSSLSDAHTEYKMDNKTNCTKEESEPSLRLDKVFLKLIKNTLFTAIKTFVGKKPVRFFITPTVEKQSSLFPFITMYYIDTRCLLLGFLRIS